MGGFAGSLAAALLWFASAAAATWASPRQGIIILVFGGMFIFPLTQLMLRASGRPYRLSAQNPMSQLAMQVAFTVPLNLLVVAGATMHRLNWFYPACMIVVGTHYLPFSFLYGMWQFSVFGGLLVAAGTLVGLFMGGSFTAGAWMTAAALVMFAFIGRSGAGK